MNTSAQDDEEEEDKGEEREEDEFNEFGGKVYRKNE